MHAANEFPLSINQQGWFYTNPLLNNREISFNDAICLRFRETPELSSLQRALDILLSRHEALRTTFRLNSANTRYPHMTSVDHSPYLQRINPTSSLKLAMIDIHTGREVQDISASVVKTVTQAIEHPFRYDVCPMMRALLLTIDEAVHILVIVISHLLTDRITTSLIRSELNELYTSYLNNVHPALALPAMQYGMFAQRQREACVDGTFAKGLAYWLNEWEVYEAALPTLGDLRPSLTDVRGQHSSSVLETHALSEDLFGKIRMFAHANNLTVYMLVVAAFFLLLHKYTGRASLATWSYVANRSQPGTAKLFGWLANTVLLGTHIDRRMLSTTLLRNVRGAILNAVHHQRVPAGLVWISFLEKHGRPPRVFDDVYVSIDGAIGRETHANNHEALEVADISAAIRPGIELWIVDEYSKGRIQLATSVLSRDETANFLNDVAQTIEWLVSHPSDSVSAFFCP
jgi:hypothetical protein